MTPQENRIWRSSLYWNVIFGGRWGNSGGPGLRLAIVWIDGSESLLHLSPATPVCHSPRAGRKAKKTGFPARQICVSPLVFPGLFRWDFGGFPGIPGCGGGFPSAGAKCRNVLSQKSARNRKGFFSKIVVFPRPKGYEGEIPTSQGKK